jgi:hypothetical protein
MARSSPMVPERKMNGMSGRISRAISSAEIPSNQVWGGFREAAAKRSLGVHALPVARESARFELTDGDLRFRRHVFHYDQLHRLHQMLPRD